MRYDPREGGASSRHALRSDPWRVHQRALLPQHVVVRVDRNGPSLNLVSQEEFQDLVMYAFSGHVYWTASSSIVQLKVGTMEEEEPGRIIAPMEGGKEERRLALPEK